MRHTTSTGYIINSEKIWVWKQGNMKRDAIIPGTDKKKLSKIAIQVGTLVPFEELPQWLDAAIPAPISLLETLSKIFNKNAVKGCQWLSLNLCNVTILFLALWLKTKWWLCPPRPPQSLFATFFFVPRDESGCERVAFWWCSRGSKRIIDSPWQHFCWRF